MPFQASDKLPAERASKLAHLDVLKSELVRDLCQSFEDPVAVQEILPTQWSQLPPAGNALKLVFGVDGSVQVIASHDKPLRTLAFVKTAMVTLDGVALDSIDKDEPHPFAIRDLLEQSQIYHATVFPLRNVRICGTTNYAAIRQIIFDSFNDPSLDGEVFETLRWLAYEKWDGKNRDLPLFECPNCHESEATLKHDSAVGNCPACNGKIYLSDMLGFHQTMGDDSAPDSVASDYMSIHETLLIFTAIRYFWQKNKDTLKSALFIKDGPLSIRAQYSKLVNPIRRFLKFAHQQGINVCLLGQEKSGRFWEHLDFIGDKAPNGSFFVPDDKYIKKEVQHRPEGGAPYGIYTNYGAKVFVKLDDRHRFVVNIPNGDSSNPQNPDLIGVDAIFSTIPKILSAKYDSALLPIQMAHSVASLSTYPSAKVLSIFADAAKKPVDAPSPPQPEAGSDSST